MKINILICSVLLLCSCEQVQKKIDTYTAVNKPVIIVIQPFDDIPHRQVEQVYDQLKRIYPHIQISKSIPLPGHAYYQPRKRYRADSLIRFLKTFTTDGQVTIGMTGKDISHTNGNIADYGIMGLGYQPGRSCVVSTFRLSKKNVSSQFFKLCLHELGHTQGLAHCPEKTCFMRDAEGKNNFDQQTAFCSICKDHLESKGWQFYNRKPGSRI